MDSRLDEPNDDHHEAFESRAIEIESDTEESENNSSGVMVGSPSAYMR